MKSIENAIRNGFKNLEIDISFTSDNKPYLFHGPTMKLVGKEGFFSEYSSSKITSFSLIDGSPIISLNKFLTKYSEYFDAIYLDIKTDDIRYKEISSKLIKTLSIHKPTNICLIGTSSKILRTVKKAIPQIRIGIEQQGAIVNYLLDADIVSLHYKYEFSYLEYRTAKLLGLGVLIWTINDEDLFCDISRKYRLTVLTDMHKLYFCKEM